MPETEPIAASSRNGSHCCEEMQREVERVCDLHTSRYERPESLISFIRRFCEYGLIIHDGGTSSVRIRFCPWCGTQLPESQRDQ